MIDVVHVQQNRRFIVRKEGKDAMLAYELQGNKINFYSTFVPVEFRGQGIAEKLVRTGIAWAKEQGYELHASCWYVKKFLKQSE